MPERELVLEPAPREGAHRGMAQGVQRGEAQEGFGRINTSSVCKTAGYERSYS